MSKLIRMCVAIAALVAPSVTAGAAQQATKDPAPVRAETVKLSPDLQARLKRQGDAIEAAARDAQTAQVAAQAAAKGLENERLKAQLMFYEACNQMKLDPAKFEFWTEANKAGELEVVLRRKDEQAKVPAGDATPPAQKPPGG